MHLLGRIDDAAAYPCFVGRQPCFPSHCQPHQVRRRAAAAQAAGEPRATDCLRQPSDDAVFDRCRRRRRSPRRHILIEHRRAQFSQGAHRLARTEDIAEEPADGWPPMLGERLKVLQDVRASPSSAQGREKSCVVCLPLVNGKAGRLSSDAQ